LTDRLPRCGKCACYPIAGTICSRVEKRLVEPSVLKGLEGTFMNRTENTSSTVSDQPTGRNLGLRLHGVRYQVTDVSRAVAFYTQHLGFTLEHQHLPAFATVSVGDLKLFLSGPQASGSRPMPDR